MQPVTDLLATVTVLKKKKTYFIFPVTFSPSEQLFALFNTI